MTGERLPNGVDYAVSSTIERSDGVERLYFPAFDTPETNFGVAEGLDGQHFGQHYGRLSASATSPSPVPTAAAVRTCRRRRSARCSTSRSSASAPSIAMAGRRRVHAPVRRNAGRTAGAVRSVHVSTATIRSQVSHSGSAWRSASTTWSGSWWTLSGRVTRPLPGQVLTLGAEYIDNVQQNQTSGYVGDAAYHLDQPVVVAGAPCSCRTSSSSAAM